MKWTRLTPTIALTIEPFTSEILIDRTVLKTNNADNAAKATVSLPNRLGNAILSSLNNFWKKSESTYPLV